MFCGGSQGCDRLLLLACQALQEAVTRLADELEAARARQRECLSRLKEQVRPGSFIAIRRDSADTEYQKYKCVFTLATAPAVPALVMWRSAGLT